MTLSNEELINLAAANSAEMNAKLIILMFFIVYAVGMLWLSNKIESKSFSAQIFKYLFLKVPAIILLFHIPLFSLFLLSAVNFEVLFGIILLFYSFYYAFIVIWVWIFGSESIMRLLGIKWKSNREFRRFVDD